MPPSRMVLPAVGPPRIFRLPAELEISFLNRTECYRPQRFSQQTPPRILLDDWSGNRRNSVL